MNGYEMRLLAHVGTMTVPAFHMTLKRAMWEERNDQLLKRRYLPAWLRQVLLWWLERNGKFNGAVLNLIDRGLIARRTESDPAILSEVATDNAEVTDYRAKTYYMATAPAILLLTQEQLQTRKMRWAP